MVPTVYAVLLLCFTRAFVAFVPFESPQKLFPLENALHDSKHKYYELNLTAKTFILPTVNITLRVYNDALPGPTFYINAGDILHITLRNHLTGPHCERILNEYGCNNNTNLHTHGLHVSPTAPSDDVMLELQPGDSYEYVISIPEDHAPGTFWYHPHLHGTTALQVGGAAHGMIIVADPPSFTPYSYPERELVLTHLYLDGPGSTTFIADEANDETFKWSAAPDTSLNFFLVNGVYQPVITMTNTWERWRILNPSAYVWIVIATNSSACTFELIAIDGIYISPAPRSVNRIFVASGSRADVLVHCSATVVPSLVELWSCPPNEPDCAEYVEPNGYGYSGLLGYINITSSDIAPSVAVFEPSRPSYLSSTLASTPAQQFDMDAIVLGSYYRYNVMNFTINYILYSEAPWANLTLNNMYMINMSGLQKHPFHLHVYPLQLHTTPLSPVTRNFFQYGDWLDNAFMPNGPDQPIFLAFNAKDISGDVVYHCHNLEHEDMGMMTYFHVSGDSEEDKGKGSNKEGKGAYKKKLYWTLLAIGCCAFVIGVIAGTRVYFRRRQQLQTKIEFTTNNSPSIRSPFSGV